MSYASEKTRTIFITAIILLVLLLFIAAAGCKPGEEKTEEPTSEVLDEVKKDKEIDEDLQETEQEQDQSDQESEVKEELKQDSEKQIEEQAEEEKIVENAILDKIQEDIDKADYYYNNGQFAEAVKAYRNVIIAVEDSNIENSKKQKLIDEININYEDACSITDTARNHHSNAMTLEYEKRFDEARAELLAAIGIYPKYQIAIDALDSLEAMMGLK